MRFSGNIDEQLEDVGNARTAASGLSAAAKNRAADLEELIALVPENVDLQQDLNDVEALRKFRFFACDCESSSYVHILIDD